MATCNAQILQSDPDIYWSYCPSNVAAIIFAVLFGLTGCVHLYQTIRYRQKAAMIITMGAVLETASYILRLAAIYKLTLKNVYEAQFILVLISPLWMNAYDFVVLGRLVNFCMRDRRLLRIPAKRIAVVFVCCDIGTFLIQLSGAAVTTATDNATVNMGLHIYTAGVALQEFFIICFLGLAIVFRRRLSAECRPDRVKSVKRLLIFLYISLGLISFRIIFRIVEFAADNQSRLSANISEHEIYMYLFDSLPMFLALVIFNVQHPGAVLTGPDAQWPRTTKAERAAKKAAKKREKEQRKANKRQRMNESHVMVENSSASDESGEVSRLA